jgi:hypothetical protein
VVGGDVAASDDGDLHGVPPGPTVVLRGSQANYALSNAKLCTRHVLKSLNRRG